ncbi:PREDICTED: uncharacterized protein LOC105449992 isoform X2 [Wasmannia auropunctata]|uniref:uncharacterized protein LOC105449992 isoform X2 n=1 Tax=Wasmannia auropunctata TaxID=64793 RepID=UPI0005EFBF91|nr:PREDICTED: uncharacterized protein LOC105449992 isoform X2 [Wasmannia auropunctata]
MPQRSPTMEVVGTGFSAIEPRKSRATDRRGAIWSDGNTLGNGTSRDKTSVLEIAEESYSRPFQTKHRRIGIVSISLGIHSPV